MAAAAITNSVITAATAARRGVGFARFAIGKVPPSDPHRPGRGPVPYRRYGGLSLTSYTRRTFPYGSDGCVTNSFSTRARQAWRSIVARPAHVHVRLSVSRTST